MAGVIEAGLWCLLLAACFTDLIWGKVYNALTLPFLAVGVILRLFGEGLSVGLATSGLAIGTAFAIFFPLYLVKVLAAGDVKLLMAVAAWLNPKLILEFAGITIVIGAFVGVLILFFQRGALGGIKSIADHATQSAKASATRVPFAPAFLCGYLVLKVAEQRGWSIL